MKTDLYTKIVLTVIAVVLTLNLVKNFDWVASAKADTAVALPNTPSPKADGVIDVNIVSIDGRSVSSQKLPVEIKGVSLPYSDNIPVTLKDISVSSFRYMPVEIKDSKTLEVKVTNTSDFR